MKTSIKFAKKEQKKFYGLISYSLILSFFLIIFFFFKDYYLNNFKL